MIQFQNLRQNINESQPGSPPSLKRYHASNENFEDSNQFGILGSRKSQIRERGESPTSSNGGMRKRMSNVRSIVSGENVMHRTYGNISHEPSGPEREPETLDLRALAEAREREEIRAKLDSIESIKARKEIMNGLLALQQASLHQHEALLKASRYKQPEKAKLERIQRRIEAELGNSQDSSPEQGRLQARERLLAKNRVDDDSDDRSLDLLFLCHLAEPKVQSTWAHDPIDHTPQRKNFVQQNIDSHRRNTSIKRTARLSRQISEEEGDDSILVSDSSQKTKFIPTIELEAQAKRMVRDQGSSDSLGASDSKNFGIILEKSQNPQEKLHMRSLLAPSSVHLSQSATSQSINIDEGWFSEARELSEFMITNIQFVLQGHVINLEKSVKNLHNELIALEATNSGVMTLKSSRKKNSKKEESVEIVPQVKESVPTPLVAPAQLSASGKTSVKKISRAAFRKQRNVITQQLALDQLRLEVLFDLLESLDERNYPQVSQDLDLFMNYFKNAQQYKSFVSDLQPTLKLLIQFNSERNQYDYSLRSLISRKLSSVRRSNEVGENPQNLPMLNYTENSNKSDEE